MEYIEGVNGKFIFIMKLLCKQVQNHQGRGQEDKRPTNQRSVLRRQAAGSHLSGSPIFAGPRS